MDRLGVDASGVKSFILKLQAWIIFPFVAYGRCLEAYEGRMVIHHLIEVR